MLQPFARGVLPVVLGLAVTCPAKAAADSSDSFSGFVELVGRYGWRSDVLPSSSIGAATQRQAWLRFEIPEDDGYYPRLVLLELTFASAAKVPLQDGKADQIYPPGPAYGGKGAFPIEEFKPLFQVDNWRYYEYIMWLGYRRGRTAYIVHTMPVRQSIDEMFGWLVSYVRAGARGDATALASLEGKLTAAYSKKKDRHEGVKILQRVFSEQGEYHGAVDGMCGRSTYRALQAYMKKEGYYRGPTDGWSGGRASRAALRRLQTALGLKATGDVTLETAQAIAERSAR